MWIRNIPKLTIISSVNIFSYPELSVQTVWEKVKNKSDVLKYLPDYKGKKLPEQFYLFNVTDVLLAYLLVRF